MAITFEQFQSTRRYVDSIPESVTAWDTGKPVPGFVYMSDNDDGGPHIEDHGAGVFHLVLEREDHTSTCLEDLERRLFDWACECYLSDEEMDA